jgi:hypothetical protein
LTRRAFVAPGGIRYSPLTENEKQVLTFDEIAPSDDGMSCDDWKEKGSLKAAARIEIDAVQSEW